VLSRQPGRNNILLRRAEERGEERRRALLYTEAYR
jgi:hypothetical protein